MSPASRALIAVVLAASTPACGNDEPAASGDETVTSLASLAEWCATLEAEAPALASPNPDGRELEVLDLHIAQNEAVAAGAPGVTPAATESAREMADVYIDMRRRVADGERLPDLIKELWSGDDMTEIIDAAETLEAEADKLC
jgi:hypothetical protein